MILPSEKEISEFYPMMMDGVRYLFKENPLIYAKELAPSLYPAEVQALADDFYFKKAMEMGKMPDEAECEELAKRQFVIRIMRDPRFKEWIKRDVEWVYDVSQFETKEPENTKEEVRDPEPDLDI